MEKHFTNINNRFKRSGFYNFLARNQHYAWPLVVIVILINLYIYWQSIQDVSAEVQTFQEAASKKHIVFEAPVEKQSESLAINENIRPADQLKLDLPEDDIKNADNIKQAAALLAESGNLEAAISLLRQSVDDSAAADSIAQNTVQRIKAEIPSLLKEELTTLKTHWNSLDKETQLTYFSEAGDLTRMSEFLDKPKVETLNKALPAAFVYALINNLHFKIKTKLACPDVILEIVLNATFTGDNKGKVRYWQDRQSNDIAYKDAISSFVLSSNKDVLDKFAKDLVIGFKDRLSNSQFKLYYSKLIGEDVIKYALILTEDSDIKAIRLFWESLPVTLQKLWGEKIEPNHKQLYSDAEIAVNPWLKHCSGFLNKRALLKMIRLNPMWLQNLRPVNKKIDYKKALSAFGFILDTIHAKQYKQIMLPMVQTSLVKEDVLLDKNPSVLIFIQSLDAKYENESIWRRNQLIYDNLKRNADRRNSSTLKQLTEVFGQNRAINIVK